MACIADDILIYGCGDSVELAQQDHDRNMIALLDRCRDKGIKLNKEKMKLNCASVTFMGHELTSDGLRPDRRKAEAIQRMPAPVDRQGLLRLLGMATFLARFCPSFSETTAPLDNEFVWDNDIHGTTLQKLKDLLSEAPVLRYYDVTKPVIVQVDSSQNGLAGCLIQSGKPVAYTARGLSRIERDGYSQIEKELLAIVFELERLCMVDKEYASNPTTDRCCLLSTNH